MHKGFNASFWLPRNLANQARTRDTMLVKSRKMTGSIQHPAVETRGQRGKDERLPNTLANGPVSKAYQRFIWLLRIDSISNTFMIGGKEYRVFARLAG